VVFPLEMISNGDSLLVLGVTYAIDSAGRMLQRAGDDSVLVGFLLTRQRRVATPIPAPHDMPRARYFRTRVTSTGWESVFFVPDGNAPVGSPYVDSGTLWYGRLVGRRWTDLERIAHVDSAVVVRPVSSDLSSHGGVLRFAIGVGDPMQPTSTGGIAIFRRLGPREWTADTIPVRGPSLSVTTPVANDSTATPVFFAVAGIWEGADFFPGSMLAVDAAHPSRWRVVRRVQLQSMNEPTEVVVGNSVHATWWEEGRDGHQASSWYQAIDPTKENDPSRSRLLVEGVIRVLFLGVPEDGRVRPVWVYQSPSSVDSAEVAVVANGEPVAIGRIAFPYAFQTNGVTSGDRSFILATMPRLIPGEGPLPSRTLGVRVDCSGASGTSKGGRHEAHVESAGARRAGDHRLHR
jgi:hypothetical protein